jgi:rieske iron-sulfur protein
MTAAATTAGLLPQAGHALDTLPQAGDLLVFEAGLRTGAPIDARDLEAAEPPVVARVMDPASRAIRNHSRFGQVLVVRPDPERLSSTELPFAADGVVGFSAICTHAACVVSGWRPEAGLFFCPCHGSVYDPAAGGAVVAGPAPRPLPILPLRITDGTLTVAGSFTGRIGASTGRTD